MRLGELIELQMGTDGQPTFRLHVPGLGRRLVDLSVSETIVALVEMAGGINLGIEPNQPLASITVDELLAINPDMIVMSPCGYDIGTTYNELETLRQQPSWQKLKAVRGKRVFLADGIQYFNRPGPRLLQSLEILAEILCLIKK